ncbi:RagB/SusD family nutrient uptake outer membrane protein [Maribellus comscasis]|nr:RagB/SusD family nutrient uptake outer membrane protein [Maribellus comscasis]
MKKILLTIGIFAVFFNSCVKDDFLDEDLKNIISADNLYLNYSGFQAGLNGMYALMLLEKGNTPNNSNYVHDVITMSGTDVACDGLWSGWGTSTGINLYDGRFTPEDGNLLNTWSWIWRVVNAANTLINRAEEPSVDWQGANEADNIKKKNEVIGEARCVRAWAYRHLVNLWNEVPLVLEESTGTIIDELRFPATRADIEAQMEADWLFASENLPSVAAVPGKVSSAVANHYLAELYLVWGDNGKAEQYANKVITSGDYQLVTERYGVEKDQPGTPFTDMFINGNINRNQGNTEVLWAWQREYQVNGGESGNSTERRMKVFAYWMWPIDGVSLAVTEGRGGRSLFGFMITKWSIDNFGVGDDRGGYYGLRKFYIIEEGDNLGDTDFSVGDTLWMDWSQPEQGGITRKWPSVTKFDWAPEGNLAIGWTVKETPYIRLADTYLLLAEALMKQERYGDAAEALNVVRRRANAPDISAGDVDIDFILDERARELLMEEHRRYTLIRTGKYVERSNAFNARAAGNITDQYKYMPIPQEIIDENPDFPQTIGWR